MRKIVSQPIPTLCHGSKRMAALVDYPAVLFVVLFLLFVAAASLGAYVLRPYVKLTPEERDNFNLIQTSTLTLLALLIGFNLSMAVNRYDIRKDYEERQIPGKHLPPGVDVSADTLGDPQQDTPDERPP